MTMILTARTLLKSNFCSGFTFDEQGRVFEALTLLSRSMSKVSRNDAFGLASLVCFGKNIIKTMGYEFNSKSFLAFLLENNLQITLLIERESQIFKAFMTLLIERESYKPCSSNVKGAKSPCLCMWRDK